MGVEQDTGLHLYTTSAPSGHRVTVLLEELGLPYTVHEVNVHAGEHKAPEFLANMNPAGLIPVLVDADEGGEPICESGAIMMYLAEVKGGERGRELMPGVDQPAKRAAVLRWLFWQNSTVYAAVRRFFLPIIAGTPTTPEAMQTYDTLLREQIGILESQLQKTGAYLAGNFVSLADLAALPYILLPAKILGIDLEKEMPAAHAWTQRLLERPAIRKGLAVPQPHVMLSGEEQGKQILQAVQWQLKGWGVKCGQAEEGEEEEAPAEAA